MTKYDGFDNWQDVAVNFSNLGYNASDAAKLAEIPEPEEVLVAAYEQGGYEGDAWVVYRNGDKYYTVEGGHCSCYGLEGKWEPEEYESAEALLKCLSKGDWTYGAKKTYIEMVKYILSERVTTTQSDIE